MAASEFADTDCGRTGEDRPVRLPPIQNDDSIDHLRAMHQRHLDEASNLQRFADHTTRLLGRPAAFAVIALVIVVWLAANYELNRHGYPALDPPPFVELEVAATLAGLGIALLILTTQRHEDELAEKRSELTLQIALLSEKKVAKVIQLLEEQRRDNPMLANRSDQAAAEMGQPTNPAHSLEAISHGTPADVGR